MLRAHPRARRVAIAAFLLAIPAAIAVAVFAARVPVSPGALRLAVIEALAERLDAEVQIDALAVDLFPRLTAAGTNLVVRHQGRRDVPPLITIRTFAVEGGLLDLWRGRVALVRLEGLDVQVPPDRGRFDVAPDDGTGHDASARRRFIVDELLATDARVVFIPRDGIKPPKVWSVHTLRMESVSASSSMPFTATLTNAVPPGQIGVVGEFGPWDRSRPGHTPLAGSFTFEHADLGAFKGLSGTLASRGAFRGLLERLEVQGETTTPDFTLDVAGNPVPLQTAYDAIVDGTDGSTRLERVDATLAETRIFAQGDVAHVEGVEGRVITLDVAIEKGRLEDVLSLAVPGPASPMTGILSLETTLILPPGDEDVVRRLQLRGGFRIDNGRFADPGVQRQISQLSARARGRRADATVPTRPVASDFSGRFALDRGVLSLPTVTFDVPGAVIDLAGRYALEAETLDFAGSLYMEARLSDAVGGFKGFMLRIVDPLFRKGGQTVVPLKVTGARRAPAFGLDMGRVFRR